MIDTDARVQAFLDAIQAAVNASSLDDKEYITVTDDGRAVENAFQLSAGAIVVYPLPAMEWPAPRTTRVTWTFAVVALIAGSARPNAKRVNELLTILTEGAGLLKFGDQATPTDFRTSDPQNTIPGYTIQHTEESYS